MPGMARAAIRLDIFEALNVGSDLALEVSLYLVALHKLSDAILLVYGKIS
jgi:hypothetical protein